MTQNAINLSLQTLYPNNQGLAWIRQQDLKAFLSPFGVCLWASDLSLFSSPVRWRSDTWKIRFCGNQGGASRQGPTALFQQQLFIYEGDDKTDHVCQSASVPQQYRHLVIIKKDLTNLSSPLPPCWCIDIVGGKNKLWGNYFQLLTV